MPISVRWLSVVSSQCRWAASLSTVSSFFRHRPPRRCLRILRRAADACGASARNQGQKEEPAPTSGQLSGLSGTVASSSFRARTACAIASFEYRKPPSLNAVRHAGAPASPGTAKRSRSLMHSSTTSPLTSTAAAETTGRGCPAAGELNAAASEDRKSVV